MPKTLQGANKNTFAGQAKVAVNGDDMEALDIEVPVQTLLDDAAYLLAELRAVAQALQGHGHSLATAEAPGFMSPGDRATIAGFTDALASHRHGNATPEADGFFSKDDKKKLNEVEAKADATSSSRVRTALGMKLVRRSLPESTFAAREVKQYDISVPGVTPDDCLLSSQYMSNAAQFGIFYHVLNDSVQVLVRNFSDTNSKQFVPGEITFMVLKF